MFSALSILNKKRTIIVLTMLLAVLPFNVDAFYSENSMAEQNSYTAGTVEVEVDTNNLSLDIDKDNAYTADFELLDISTLNHLKYSLTSTLEACAAEFYNGIDIAVNWDTTIVYGDALVDLDATSTNDGSVSITIEANSGIQAEKDEICVVSLKIVSWQKQFSADTHGFSDSEEIELIITASEDMGQQTTNNVVMNEIYPSTLATTTEPLEREWVELYNGTDSAIDIVGWSLGEHTSGSTTMSENLHTVVEDCSGYTVSDHMQPYDTSNTVVPAGGYLILEFCGSAEYLYDDGDTVTLYDDTSTLIDSHTYPTTSNGKSHARIPDGSDWVDPVPTPGKQNTATRDDLEAEGWSKDKIDKTLDILEKQKTDDTKEDATSEGGVNDSDQEAQDETPKQDENNEQEEVNRSKLDQIKNKVTNSEEIADEVKDEEVKDGNEPDLKEKSNIKDVEDKTESEAPNKPVTGIKDDEVDDGSKLTKTEKNNDEQSENHEKNKQNNLENNTQNKETEEKTPAEPVKNEEDADGQNENDSKAGKGEHGVENKQDPQKSKETTVDKQGVTNQDTKESKSELVETKAAEEDKADSSNNKEGDTDTKYETN